MVGLSLVGRRGILRPREDTSSYLSECKNFLSGSLPRVDLRAPWWPVRGWCWVLLCAPTATCSLRITRCDALRQPRDVHRGAARVRGPDSALPRTEWAPVRWSAVVVGAEAGVERRAIEGAATAGPAAGGGHDLTVDRVARALPTVAGLDEPDALSHSSHGFQPFGGTQPLAAAERAQSGQGVPAANSACADFRVARIWLRNCSARALEAMM